MTDKDRNEALDHRIDRLLEGAAGQPEGEPRDPLLDLASALHETLQQPARPSPEFRARLKAELLEHYADNVRPFPAAVRTTVRPPVQHRVRHIRHAVVA